jgi:hypothetical protein
MMKARSILWFATTCLFAVDMSFAYEINNHADMSQVAAEISVLQKDANSKLRRLGLRKIDIADPRQTFPLGTDPANASRPLGPIPYCFGSVRPEPFSVTTNQGLPVQDRAAAKDNWLAAGGTSMTIAQLFRYGACYEDEEHPFARTVSHFYNVQGSILRQAQDELNSPRTKEKSI